MERISRWLPTSPVLLLALCWSGCQSTHKVVAARHTDCPYKQIEISDEAYAADQETWVARCGEQRYLCSTTNTNNRLKYRCKRLSSADAGSAVEAVSDAGVLEALADAGSAAAPALTP